MPPPRPLRLTPEWDDRFTRMVAVSTMAHAVVLGFVVLVAGRAASRPLPLVAYTVELTDPSALGGRLPPGAPAADLSGGPASPPAPEPKGEPAAPPAPPEPKAEAKPTPEPETKPEPKPEPPAEAKVAAREEPTVHIPDKPKPPEPKPEPPKPEPPKAVAPKPEPPKPPAAKPAPPKAVAKASEPPKPESKAPAKPPEARPGSPAGGAEEAPRDAYAAAAERWRARGGGGLGGSDAGSGPIGAGGTGPGGGGQLVGLEFMAYRQQVINTIKAQWTNVIARPGLVAAVRFEIAPDGQVSNVRLAQSSGNQAYDASAIRAVQHTSQLPAPPARYASEFRDFVIEFHSEETGGRGQG